MANQLYMPNLLQSFNQGVDRGRQNRLAKLAGQAYTTAPEGRNALLGEIASISPRAAAQESVMFQRQDAGRQKRLAGAANYLLQARKSGNPQAVEGAYQAVRPFLAETSGQEPPEQFDPAMWPMIYRIAAANGAKFDMDPNSPAAVQAFEYFAKDLTPEQMQRAREIHLGLAPRAGQPRLANGYQVVQTPNGPIAQPIPIAGAGQDFTAPEAGGGSVTFDFAPGTPQSVIDAAHAAAVANGDIAPSVEAQGAPAAPTGKTLADVTGKQASPGKIQQRQKELQQLAARGVNLDDAQRQQYLVTGKLPASFQGNSDVQALGDISLSGEQYLQTIPDSERGVVKGLLNGTVELPRGTALKNGFWQAALASVKHADPSWNQGAYKQYVNARKYFTIGQGGQLINSINTAAQHLDKLREDIEAMHNGDNRYLAAAGNYLGSHFGGDQAPTNFMADLTPVASELAAVYKGKGVPSDAEIAHFQNALSQNMSYGQQMNVIRGWIDLLSGKLNATRNQYQQSMTKLSDPLDVINPRAKDALNRITHLANAVSNTGQHPMPQMSQTPINAPGGSDQSIPQPTVASPQSAAGGDDIDSVLQSLGVQ